MGYHFQNYIETGIPLDDGLTRGVIILLHDVKEDRYHFLSKGL